MTDDTLIIFDCDGTLVDSEPIANRVFVEQVREYGIPLTDAEAWQHFPGTSLSNCMQYVIDTYKFIFPDEFITVHRERQAIAFAKTLQPIAGIREALDLISTPRCVASNGPRPTMEANLGTTGLIKYFTDLYSAHDIQVWKPEPDLFLHAARSQGMQPGQCIVVEDSNAGIQAANRAGMRVLAFEPIEAHYKLSEKGTASFSMMNQLPQLINQLVQ